MASPVWTAHQDGRMHAVFIDCDDFEHDARLYLTGDFASVEDKLAYATQIAHALNQLEFVDCDNFELNAKLHLVGDFASVEDKIEYANQIADKVQILWRKE